MIFQSFEFFIGFLPALLVIYFVVRRFRVLSTLVLIVGSAIFYAWRSVWWLVPLIVVATVDYFVGLRLAALPDGRARWRWLLLSLVVNLGMLSVFKYAGWVTLTTDAMFRYFGIAASMPVLVTMMPPGISFYTFETMSYTIDVYRRQFPAERSFLIYLNFVLFFPHLVAGPILRPRDLIGQLKVVRPIISAMDARLALCQLAWGLFKKIVLADNFGDVVHYSVRIQHNYPDQSGGMGLIYALAFALQIYCDFSAYSDMARGSALLFGIKLPRNFLTPLFARAPQEFWQRWHITLSTWIRDYVYIPLGGRLGDARRQTVVLLATMGLAGLWHGAGLLFIVWGFYHGALILLYRRPAMQAWLKRCSVGGPAVAAWALFFALNTFGWMIFRAGSGDRWEFLQMAATFAGPFAAGTLLAGLNQLLLLAAPVLITEWLAYRRDTEFPEVLCGLRTVPLSASFVAMWFTAVIFAKRAGYDFIYFAF